MSEKKYSLKLTPRANKDLEEIYNYISKELHAEESATKILAKIETSIMTLKKFPLSCNYVADEFLRLKGYRKLIVDNYIAFYIVNEEKEYIVVMRVLYGRQKYQSLL